jgi:hypothetical protein
VWAGKEAYTAHTVNIISQRQYFVARFSYPLPICLWFTQYLRLFSFCPQASDVSKTLVLISGTVEYRV